MQRYIINIKLQNLNFFLKLTNIKKTVVIRFKISIFALSDTTYIQEETITLLVSSKYLTF